VKESRERERVEIVAWRSDEDHGGGRRAELGLVVGDRKGRRLAGVSGSWRDSRCGGAGGVNVIAAQCDRGYGDAGRRSGRAATSPGSRSWRRDAEIGRPRRECHRA